MAKYRVTAVCDNPKCPTDSFERERKKMTYMGSDDNEHVIRKLVCPGSGMHAQVTSIEQIRKKVA